MSNTAKNILKSEVISEEGAAVRVERIVLTDSARRELTTSARTFASKAEPETIDPKR